MPLLLKSQKALLFDIIKTNRLDPANFTIGEEESTRRKGEKINAVSLKGTEYYFAFDWDSHGNTFYVFYSPGQETPLEEGPAGDWNYTCHTFAQWLSFLSREMETYDPWEQLAEYSQLVEVSPARDMPNNAFTFPELEGIWKGLTAIQATLLEHAGNSAERQQFITGQISYLIESSKRMGRKDWLVLAIGTFVGIVSNMALSADVTHQIFNQLKDVLAGFVELIPRLL